MSEAVPPVWTPGGAPGVGHGGGWQPAPRPDTDLVGPRVLNHLLDALVAFVASLLGVVLVVPGLVLGEVWLAVAGAYVGVLAASLAAGAWVQVGRPRRGPSAQTYGMAAMGLEVVDAATLARPTTRQLVLRWLLLVVVDGGVVGLVVLTVTDEHQRLGDLAAKTLVVRSDDPALVSTRAGGVSR